jgi:hypothetical protein
MFVDMEVYTFNAPPQNLDQSVARFNVIFLICE